MAFQIDFNTGEDLEAIHEAIEEETWDKNFEEFTAEVDVFIREIEEEPSKSEFKCKNARSSLSPNKVF